MLQKIEPECAEELSQVVAPWQLTLRQLSAGALRSCISFTAIDDILVTNDRWQGCIHGFGGTAANYFTIIGAVDIFQIPWNGTVLDENTLACAAGNVEWEFVTPHGTNHWVVMIPAQRLADYMGVEPLQVLGRESLLLRCDPGRFQRFSALANRCLRRDRQAGGIAVPTGTGTQLKAEMMESVWRRARIFYRQ